MKTPIYGRLLEDFEPGATYEHPWEVTVDEGSLALFAGSFLDASPVYASRALARKLGFRDRPVHPLLLLNLGLSFSVHDVSEQAIAHLAYIDVRFPNACHPGDSVRASSRVLDARPAKSGDRGVVHVRTLLVNQDDAVVCAFERKALVRGGGKLQGRPASRLAPVAQPDPGDLPRLPEPLRERRALPRALDLPGYYEDFAPGDVILHGVGKTVGESEHMQLTALCRNTHPLHFEEPYARAHGFAGTRVVYGGLVFAWVASLASRDTTGQSLWDLGFDQGAHPAGVVAGDTLYAASRVLAVEDRGADAGAVTFKLVGTKNARPGDLLAQGADLFADELTKKEGKVKEKVFEIQRTVLVRKAR